MAKNPTEGSYFEIMKTKESSLCLATDAAATDAAATAAELFVIAVKIADDDYQVLSNDITWWRGGTLSKLMFQRWILPSSMIRKDVCKVAQKRYPNYIMLEYMRLPDVAGSLSGGQRLIRVGTLHYLLFRFDTLTFM